MTNTISIQSTQDITEFLYNKLGQNNNLIEDIINRIKFLSKSYNIEECSIVDMLIKTNFDIDLTEIKVMAKIVEAGNEY